MRIQAVVAHVTFELNKALYGISSKPPLKYAQKALSTQPLQPYPAFYWPTMIEYHFEIQGQPPFIRIILWCPNWVYCFLFWMVCVLKF